MRKTWFAVLVSSSLAMKALSIEDKPVQSSFVPLADRQTGFAEVLCDDPAIPAYTSDLLLSKQNDLEDPVAGFASEEKKASLYYFANTIAGLSDDAILQEDALIRRKSAACLQHQLHHWAASNAMLHVPASKTGKAMRAWMLSAISSSLMKLQSIYTDFELDSLTLHWLELLGEEVRTDFSEKMASHPERVNHQDYWAAWALGATSVVTQNRSFLRWAQSVFDFAMTQAVTDRGVAYFPNEVSRGRLGSDYSNFAFVPVMFLGELLKANKRLERDDRKMLKRMARFNYRAAIKKQRKTHRVLEGEQIVLGYNKYIWVAPYLQMFGVENSLSVKIITTYKTLTDTIISPAWFMVGGDLSPFYPVEDWINAFEAEQDDDLASEQEEQAEEAAEEQAEEAQENDEAVDEMIEEASESAEEALEEAQEALAEEAAEAEETEVP